MGEFFSMNHCLHCAIMIRYMKAKPPVYRPMGLNYQPQKAVSKHSHSPRRAGNKVFKKNKKPNIRFFIVALLVSVILLRIAFPRQNIIYNDALKPDTIKNTATLQKQPIDPDVNKLGSLKFVVNKQRPMDLNYVPVGMISPKVGLRLNSNTEQMQLVPEVSVATEKLFGAARELGYDLQLSSGFRSSAYQKELYQTYVSRDGQAVADRSSARPGFSEHQTGLAMDVNYASDQCSLDICFGDTPAGKWIAANAQNYGFIVRYQNGKTAITGYQYEPWHLRYVGVELAKQITLSNKTMEEYFGLPPAPNY
jgi:zinc D-Ala-D-Ala carboxypeptidase